MSIIENDNPNIVSSESQKAKILEYLEEGETITSLEALRLFKCFRLASRMNDLKNVGVKFESIFISTPTEKRVKAYYIPEAFAEKHCLDVSDDEIPSKAGSYAVAKITGR